MKSYLKKLSLARGALQSIFGRETKEYKNTASQITNLETALKNNPAFTRHDMLGKNNVFLYDSNNDRVFRQNDILVTEHGRYTIKDFNLKKQEISCYPLLSEEEIKETKRRMAVYGRNNYTPAAEMLKMGDLVPSENKYCYKALIRHIENATESDRDEITAAGSKDFYKFPQDVKEKWYDIHIAVMQGYSRDFYPLAFIKNKDNSIEITKANYISSDSSVINPFSAEGKAAILGSVNSGIEYSQYDKDSIFDMLKSTLPEYAVPVQQAIEKAEEASRRAELKAVETLKAGHKPDLKEEFEIKLQTKMNADKNHIKTHVHFAR
jgi:hypothetical protein